MNARGERAGSAQGALEVAARAAQHLERLGISYVVVGSVASSVHGEPRGTLDVDIVVRLRASEVEALCTAFEGEFFVDRWGLRESVRTGFPSNLIHRVTHVKLDLYVRPDEGIYAEERRRARCSSVRRARQASHRTRAEGLHRIACSSEIRLRTATSAARHPRHRQPGTVPLGRIARAILIAS